MKPVLLPQLTRGLARQAIPQQEILPLSVAMLVGCQEFGGEPTARAMFTKLAVQLHPKFEGDANDLVQDWLSDPGISDSHWECVELIYAAFKTKTSGPIDWTGEFETALEQQFGHIPVPIARGIVRAANLPISGSFACLFQPAATLAWAMSAEREVTAFPADRNLAIIMVLLARAACRPLQVDRRNPLDGTHMSAPYFYESPAHVSPVQDFDFIVSCPPFGQRLRDGEFRGESFETVQAKSLAPLARRRFITLLPDGPLFRELRSEAEFREWLIREYQVEVTSLPTGIWDRASGLQTSMISVRPQNPGAVSFVDGRTMRGTGRSGKDQEMRIVEHLDALELAPRASVEIEELAENGFSLAVNRYAKNAEQTQVETALEGRRTVRLGDVAQILRPKAPLALRGKQEPLSGLAAKRKPMRGGSKTRKSELVSAYEISPADITDGHVSMTGRQVHFEPVEAKRLNAVRIEAGDILVSIKGNVGLVGLVGDDPIFHLPDDSPWIVSQSLAIIRTPRGKAMKPPLLAAILSAPAARMEMQRLSGGSTVPILPIGLLKDLEIPVPDKDAAIDMLGEIEDIEDLRFKATEITNTMRFKQRQLWSALWNLPIEFGED